MKMTIGQEEKEKSEGGTKYERRKDREGYW
jgi:hypothetical protein